MKLYMICVCLAFPLIASAQPIEAGASVEGTMRVRPWPLGLGLNTKLSYQHPFYEGHHRALERNGVETGLLLQASPVSAHPGVFMKVTPLTVLEVEFGAQVLTYFGFLNSALLFSSEDANWSISGQKSQRDEVGLLAETGWSSYVLSRLKLMVSSVVLVSEFEYRHLQLTIDEDQTWYDPERHQLMRSTDTYNRSLTILGWLVGDAANDSDMVASAFWHEWSGIVSSERTLAGLAYIRQRREKTYHSRWLFLAAMYVQDKYHTNEPFGALVWQRVWSL